jgi:hypothetical protein
LSDWVSAWGRLPFLPDRNVMEMQLIAS